MSTRSEFGPAITGARTGRTWAYHPTVDVVRTADGATAPGSGERYRATATDDGSLALLHQCQKDSYWDDEVLRLRHAIYAASRPAVTRSRFIRQLIDVSESPTVSTEFGPIHGYLSTVWEWADASLEDLLTVPDSEPTAVADEIEHNIREALGDLHAAGIVHLDVAPNNIFRVDGVWKLGDLDSCRRRGRPVRRGPRDVRYLHPDRVNARPPAREDFDTWALAQVVDVVQRSRAV